MIVRKSLKVGEKVIYEGRPYLDNRRGVIVQAKYGKVISSERKEFENKSIRVIKCLFTDGSYESFYEKIGVYNRVDSVSGNNEELRRPNCIERLFDQFEFNPDKS